MRVLVELCFFKYVLVGVGWGHFLVSRAPARGIPACLRVGWLLYGMWLSVFLSLLILLALIVYFVRCP